MNLIQFFQSEQVFSVGDAITASLTFYLVLFESMLLPVISVIIESCESPIMLTLNNDL